MSYTVAIFDDTTAVSAVKKTRCIDVPLHLVFGVEVGLEPQLVSLAHHHGVRPSGGMQPIYKLMKHMFWVVVWIIFCFSIYIGNNHPN